MKHSYYIIFTFISLINLTTSFGQGKEFTHGLLFNIRRMYEQINVYKNYKIVTIDNSEEFLGHNTDNGGELKGYFKGDSLKKVVVWVGLSNKVIQNEYYYNNDTLFFVFSTESNYRFNDSTQSFDYSKLDIIFKGRYYYRKEQLIDTILNDTKHIATKKQDALDFLTSSKDYFKLFKARSR